MRWWWSMEQPGGFWLAPVLLGVILILIGALLYVMPQLLAYVIAAVFVLAGFSLIGTGWRMRSRVSYRRVDRVWRVDDVDSQL